MTTANGEKVDFLGNACTTVLFCVCEILKEKAEIQKSTTQTTFFYRIKKYKIDQKGSCTRNVATQDND